MKKGVSPELHEYFSAMGRKGGKARLKTMTAEQRREIATKAVRAREARRKGRPQ